MKVKVAKRMYSMSKEKYKELLEVASEQVPLGIYAIEKKGYAELRCDKCISITQTKKLRQDFRAAGYKVYANGI